MATVTITINDLGEGDVNFKFESDPPLDIHSGERASPAQETGMFMLQQVHQMFAEPQEVAKQSESVIQSVDGGSFMVDSK